MIISLWHTLLDMPKNNLKWHQDDLKDEIEEWKQARGFWENWSEISDVVYTYTRGRWSGHKMKRPISIPRLWWGVLYMIPKYTLRWMFYRVAALRVGSKVKIRAIRNPKKTHKLEGIAKEWGLPKKEFVEVCEKMLHWWPLLK